MRHLSSALVLFSLSAVACNDGQGGSKQSDGAAGVPGDAQTTTSDVRGTGGAIIGTGGAFAGGSGGVAGAPGAGGSTGSDAREAAAVDARTPTLDGGGAVDVGTTLDGTRIDAPTDSRMDAAIADGDGGGLKIDGAPDAPFEGAFSYTGGMSVGRWYHTATLLTDGRVLVTGGDVNPKGPDYTAEIWDPATGTFSPTHMMTTPRELHTATRLPDGRVFIVGGLKDLSKTSQSSAETYDPAAGKFTAVAAQLATARNAHTATLLGNGKILIAGGLDSTGYNVLTSAELYDPATDTFTPTGSMTAGRELFAAVPLQDGRVLMVGGAGSGILSSAELYDPDTGTFTATGSMATPRYRFSATLLGDGRVLVASGRSDSDTRLSSAEVYDPATGRFTSTSSMLYARSYHHAALLPSGKVLLAGGSGDACNTAEVFDPSTGKFTRTSYMAEEKINGSATVLLDGRVLLVGGIGNATYSGTAELYQETAS